MDANRKHRDEFYIKVAIKNVAKDLPNLMRTIEKLILTNLL